MNRRATSLWAGGEGSGRGRGQVSPSWACRGVCSRPHPPAAIGEGHVAESATRVCPTRKGGLAGANPTDGGTSKGEITEHTASLKHP